MERVWRRVQGAGRRGAAARCGCPVQPCQLHVDQRAKRGGSRKSRGGPQTIVCGCQVQPCPVHPVLIRVRRTRPAVGNCDCPPESQPCPHAPRTSAVRRLRRCDCSERPCRHSAPGGGTRHRVPVQPSSPTFSQASLSNQQQQQQQQQPCECAERVNCSHTGGGECECGEEAKPCSHTARQRRPRGTCDCSGSGSQPCGHKPQHEGRIKRVKCRVRRAGCAMARCTAELAMLHLHWGLAAECAPCRPRALTRRLCRRQQSDNELYRSNSFKFERFERSKDECATPLRKQMVTTQPDSGATGSVTPDDGGTTFSKWRQLGSDVIRDVTKFGPAKVTPAEETQPKEETTTESTKTKSKTGDDCRVCRKSFAPEESSRICCECQHKVCEDCACYSTTTNSDDPSSWRCSVCRRKLASRDQPIVTQESTDSLLEVPVLEALQRRHSDARLGYQSGSQIGGLGSGLAPPRSPEVRRHSDASPDSLKALEKFRKVAGERREDLSWERDLDRNIKSRAGSPDRHQLDRKRAISPQRVAVETSSVGVEPPESMPIDVDEEEERRRRTRRGSTVRCKTRMTRQRSCDDEMKNVAAMSGGGGQHSHPEPGLGLPVQLSRRASAYDVYDPPGVGGLNAMAIAAAQQRASISAQGGRKPEERPTVRRSSFRAVKPVMPYEVGGEDESMMNLEGSSVPVVPPQVVPQPVLVPDEDRRMRRRRSQLPDINAIKAKVASPSSVNRVAAEDREMARQGSLVDGESIKIVIHHADNDMSSWINSKRRITLRRDPTLDKGHRTAGFGLRVVGGKTGADGRTFAYVMWTVPDGPAAKAGIQRGDKVLEWTGVSLVDRSFEEVAEITERGDDMVELIVEHVTDTGDLPDDLVTGQSSGKVPGNIGLLMEGETDKTPSSPTRRKLPKTPEQIAKEKQVTGRVQIQVSYEADRKELIVSVFMADDLCARDDTGYGTLPEAYAKLVLVPVWEEYQKSADQTTLKTAVAEPSQKPIWNATLLFSGVDGESLMKRAIEVTLWDFCPDGDNVFLGECTVDLQRALENDRAVWYRLEDPRRLRASKSPYVSPHGSFSMEVAQRLLRKTELRERSYSDDTQSDSGSPELGFLHPDHAWHANSRRGSSQSEQLEVEPYELNRDYSRSLPGSRRSSVQSQGGTDSKRGSMGEADMPAIMHYNRDRRRSSYTRPPRDPEEILEGLRALKATRRDLNRTMSLAGDKRRESRRGERKDSVMNIPERFYDRNSESDEEDKWSQPTRNENGVDAKLGRGQVPPKGSKMIAGAQNGEVKLGFCLSKGTLEVEVICARDICPGEKEEPDTYVKTYLRDGDRWLQKRKTRVIRHSRNPQYRQTIKYSSCDALGRNLLVMLWEKKQAFESNQGLGGAEVNLDLLPLTRLTVDWYPLFPIHTLGTHTADSP